MKTIAFVGTTIALSENEERDIQQFVAIILYRYNSQTDLVISGGARGVDTIAIRAADNSGFRTKVYRPKKEKWEFYKERNLQIANDCDDLYCISVPVHKTKCYHCDNSILHEKTAGCWTAWKADKLHKNTQLLVTPER